MYRERANNFRLYNDVNNECQKGWSDTDPLEQTFNDALNIHIMKQKAWSTDRMPGAKTRTQKDDQ